MTSDAANAPQGDTCGPFMQAAASEVEKQFPDGIDVLINNAGILSDHVTHLNMCARAALQLDSNLVAHTKMS